jgi:hypothetical protein
MSSDLQAAGIEPVQDSLRPSYPVAPVGVISGAPEVDLEHCQIPAVAETAGLVQLDVVAENDVRRDRLEPDP